MGEHKGIGVPILPRRESAHSIRFNGGGRRLRSSELYELRAMALEVQDEDYICLIDSSDIILILLLWAIYRSTWYD